MMKALVIIGNMCSGKSTLCSNIIKRSATYGYLCVDDIRKDVYVRYNSKDGPEKERICADLLLKRIDGKSNLLYESIGQSKLYKSAIKKLKKLGFKIRIVKLNCSSKACIMRFIERKNMGHLQLRPAYNKLMSSDEFIKLNESGLKLVCADIVLDSEHLNPDQLFHDFVVKFKNIINDR